jgi:predicted PhzF superfamily epimerase YddE/YHI9
MKIYQIDSFTTEKFKGNPAAVVITPRAISKKLMKAIASEMNLSETAFVEPVEGNIFNLRWFTPSHEVTLCGHATLAAAHLLYEKEFADTGLPVEFHTLSGPLYVNLKQGTLSMDFPRIPTERCEFPEILNEAYPGKFIEAYTSDLDLILRMGSELDIVRFTPKMHILAEPDYRGIIITAESKEQGLDFVSRFFGPRVGVPEDPVTGSANVLLADYWHKQTGKSRFQSKQLSSRGGEMGLEIQGNRVIITGHAVTVMEAEFYLD